MKLFYQKFTVLALLIVLSGFLSTSIKAQILFNEGFTTVVPLPAGWGSLNNSSPLGGLGWFQGNNTVFNANSAPNTAYIAANFNNTGDNGTISNWLFAPVVTLKNGDIFSFYTRVPTGGAAFPDRLQVRMSTNGASTTVGVTATSVGDFTDLLLDINPTYSVDYPEVWTQYSVTISGLAAPISGRLAFRYFVEDAGFFGTNSNYIGIDDVKYQTFSGPCAGTPAPGAVASTAATICPAIPFTLSLVTSLNESGLSYQWQSSPDGTAWTDITGATLATLTTTQSTATYYRLRVTCGANAGFSGSIQVTMNPATSCYCLAGGLDDTFEKISNVKYGSINNSSTSTDPYENFTAISTTVERQNPTPITVTISNGFAADQVVVFIDYNQDGDFTDAGETVYTSVTGAGPHTGIITIPATALLGTTRLRVRMHDSSFGANAGPCGNSEYGQVEDYSINITPCVPVTVTAQPANATITCGAVTSFVFGATGTGLTYQWQQRNNASSQWNNITNGPIYAGATTGTLTLNNPPVTYNGYQYRVIFTGGCSGTDFSSTVTLTVNPLVATVTKTPAGDICLGGIQQLTITNTTPSTVYTVSSAPALNITIPDDGSTTGVSNTLNVATIPAGVTIVSIKVKVDLTHSWAGDMIMALRHNGKVLNLAYALDASGGVTPTTAFRPTYTSQGGLVANSGADPYAGTYIPDGYDPASGDPTVPTGPDGNVPTTANPTTRNTFTVLYNAAVDATTTLNGPWTLAMYDYFPDVVAPNKFNNWSIEITYSGGFANGVWTSPTPNSLYTDAAATTLYNGTTPVNTVYAKPTTAGVTNYSVVVDNGICVTAPLTVPVTANVPLSALVSPASTVTCQNGTASFTASATGGAFTYVWEVSTNGTTWTTVADNTIYSGATTGTLTVTGAPFTYNGYQYRATLNVAACGTTATSTAATLTVNPTPTVTIAATPAQLYPGLGTTLTSTVGPNAGATYQWFKNGVAITGATAATFAVDVDGFGTYTLTSTDVNGCSATSNALVISALASDVLFIYPSPNTGQFQVRYQSLTGNSVLPRGLVIYDSKGARVYSKAYPVTSPYTRMDVDMTNYSKGIYRVELLDVFGNRLKTGSVIIN